MSTNTAHDFSAGQTISCTVKAEPRSAGAEKTIARLMRRDPSNRKALQRAQMLRERRMNKYIRGNRLWVAREKASRVVRVVPGAAWTMTYTHDIAPDIASVSEYLEIK